MFEYIVEAALIVVGEKDGMRMKLRNDSAHRPWRLPTPAFDRHGQNDDETYK